MENNQELLAAILSKTIKNYEPSVDEYVNIEWEPIYQEAKKHHVHSLLYPILKKLHETRNSTCDSISNCLNEILMESMFQAQNTDNMKNVLMNFNNEDIPVMALKGLVLRELYPYPELRIMTDADILIHEENVKRAVKLLKKLGYYIVSSDSKHIHFEHDVYLSVELHKCIVSSELILNGEDFNKKVWDNPLLSEFHGASIYILKYEDQILYLIMHMASHLISTGFGLRQLCDLTLLVESKKDEIDWKHFCHRASEYGIMNFAIKIFFICHRLLGMVIPGNLYNQGLENDQNIDILIEHIFSCGVFGFRTEDIAISGVISRFTDQENSQSTISILKNSLSILFPPLNMLGAKYRFIQKYPVLAPAAWLHRLIMGFFRRDYNLQQKISILFPSKTSASLTDRRIKLLHWLELR